MVFHTVPRCILKRGLQFFHGNVFRFLSYPSPLLFICMTKLNDFILNFIWNRQNFPYGPAEEEGEGNSRKIGLGVDGVLGYQKVSNQSRHAYWDEQKKLKKNSHPKIQTKFHTKTKIEKLWHLWQNSDQNGWKHLPFGVAQTYMAQNKCENRGDRGPKPSAFPPFQSWLLSFGSFFDCEILSNVL